MKMKMNMNITQNLIIMALHILNTGCACTHYIRNLGVTDVQLHPKYVLIDKDENVVVDADLIHKRRAPKRIADLGHRYIVASPQTVRQTIAESKVSRGPIPINYRSVKSDYKGWINPRQNPIWHLRPPDTKNHIPYSYRDNPLDHKKTSVHRVGDVVTYHDAEGNPIEVRFEQFEVEQQNKQFRAAWGYPMQILVVPAFAIDVVTFPIQFFALTQSLGNTH
jgi:hypothetical protein